MNIYIISLKPLYKTSSRISPIVFQYTLPISHLTVIGGFGGRGMVSQSIHKPFLPSARKAFTRAFTKHSQEHSQSPHKSIHKVFTKTFTKLSQTLSRGIHKSIHKDIRKALTNSLARSAAIFFRAAPRARMRSSPARSAAIFSGQPPRARTRRRREEEENTNLSPQVPIEYYHYKAGPKGTAGHWAEIQQLARNAGCFDDTQQQ